MSSIKLFESKQIRSVWVEKEQKWFFSIVDVVGALTESPDSKDYWHRIKKREKISGIELSTICRQLKLEAPDGKLRATDCAEAEGVLRIIQSIPYPKAEPFKLWLARVGYERLEEYREFKALNKQRDSLRDHMTDLELIFTMLGEASTTEIARNRDTLGFVENQDAAVEGGTVAGNARRELEQKSALP